MSLKTNLLLKLTASQAIQLGRETLTLIEGRQRELAPRLPEGTLDRLVFDIKQLESLYTERPAVNIKVKGLTGTEMEKALSGARLVTAIRTAVKKRAANTGLPKAVGVGSRFYPFRSASVVSAIEAILKAATDNPDAIRACGILDADIARGRELLDTLRAARETQDMGVKDKKNLTTQKNIVQHRIEQSLREISTAGYLQYMDKEPFIAERFKGIMPTSSARKVVEETTETPGAVVLVALTADKVEIKTEDARQAATAEEPSQEVAKAG